MKIGIDALGCDHGKSGIGSYLYSLINVLSKNDDVDFELFGSEVDRFTFNQNIHHSFTGVDVKDDLLSQRLWHFISAVRFIKKRKYDVVLFPAAVRMLPSWFSKPSVVIINEIPSRRMKKIDFLYKAAIKKGISKADCVIVPSMYVKKDIEKFIKCRRIEIVHNGIDHSVFHPVNDSQTEDFVDIKPFAIKKPYIIYGSRMQGPDKKHIELIKAFNLFKERTGLPHRLVLAGEYDEYGEQVHKVAFESPYASDIFITGFFPHESFGELYRNAEACIFPAVNEGVGLPVLEAMACGIPVACSSSGSLSELTCSNALYFDSDNIEDIAEKIQTITLDKELRGKLISDGLEWSKRFDWNKTAAEILKIAAQL